MKTVLLCIPTLASAGAERFVTELACNINKNSFRAVVLITNKLDEKSDFYKKLRNSNIEVLNASGKNYLTEIINIIRFLREYRPDIIHSNVGAALHMLIPLFLSHCKATHLFTVHSMGYRIFTGTKKKLMHYCFKHRFIIPVAICDKVKQSLIEAYDLKDNEVELVYNGVDTRLFKPIKRDSTDIVFVTVGTLYKIKNHALLIDAFSLVHKTCPNSKLIIVGDGELKDNLVYQTTSLGLEKDIVFAGKQSDVSYYLNNSDVYCCSSEVEGLPISVLEAMACGLPIVTTPAGGVVDIVSDSYNGFIVSNEPGVFADKMKQLATDAEIRRVMALNSRCMAEKLDILHCSKAYEALYEKYSEKTGIGR